MTSKEMGQYFTTNVYLKECVYQLILNNPKCILEPSMGRGDLVEYVQNKCPDIGFDMYEIDTTIDILDTIDKKAINYGDFLVLVKDIDVKYATIIGNPPYVKVRSGNLYIEFITKCYELLEHGGELIFIVPSDFIKLTSSNKIINKMMENGTFTHIIHPNDEKLFENASVDVIIFRYCKDISLDNKILVNEEEKYLINTNGILTFSDDEPTEMHKFSEYFDIYVGIVSGKESVFKNANFGNIDVLNGKDKIDKYILLHSFPSGNDELDNYMLSHKDELISRKIRKFTDENWHEWGALRNYETIDNRLGEKCIYVNNLTRTSKVCFKGVVQHFGGRLLIMIPNSNQDCESLNIDKVVKYINSDKFKTNYMYSGRFKIGHKQLCNALFNPAHFT